MDPPQFSYAPPLAPDADASGSAAPNEPQLNNLIINFIPSSLSEAGLRELFAPHGTVEHCKLVLDKLTGS